MLVHRNGTSKPRDECTKPNKGELSGRSAAIRQSNKERLIAVNSGFERRLSIEIGVQEGRHSESCAGSERAPAETCSPPA